MNKSDLPPPDRPLLKHRQDEVRRHIQVDKLLRGLHAIADGTTKATPQEKQARISAAQILLRKALPDLTSVDIKAEHSGTLTIVVQKVA